MPIFRNKPKRSHTTFGRADQHARWLFFGALVCLHLACHRPPGPLDADPALPAGFRSPENTFQTWIAASVAGDETRIRACYWPDMDREELQAWLAENLRPEAAELLHGARFQGFEPVSLVEVNFTFVTRAGESMSGVMVRTRQGWKLQRW
jgi:hypothetical protein